MSLIWLLSLATLAGTAPALDPATQEDVRCLTAMFALAGQESKDQQSAGTLGALYFLGRIDGRSPGLDLETAVAAESKRLTDDELGKNLQTCGTRMESRGKDIIALGKALEKRGL